jgi:hypothetical protein
MLQKNRVEELLKGHQQKTIAFSQFQFCLSSVWACFGAGSKKTPQKKYLGGGGGIWPWFFSGL